MQYVTLEQVSLDRKLYGVGEPIDLDPEGDIAAGLLAAGAIAEPDAGPVERIRRAIEGLDAGDYTAAGVPKASALAQARGEPVTAAERDAAWALHVSLSGAAAG
ncbi:MAG: hypothetical protein OXB97_04450 [Rhodospirillales bacterium]|nr:hypothetical protein [Rhodospirillales bacterium]